MNNECLATPYTYFIKHKETGYFYYGVKYSKNADPNLFWVNYFTSSKSVKKLIEIYGKDSFDIQIRRTFKDVYNAKKWEDKVISKIRNWDKCLNICVGGDAIKSHKNRHIKDKDGLSIYDKASLKTAETRKLRGDFERLSEFVKNNPIGKIHTCEFCNKIVRGANYTRWHGDNCKYNPEITIEQVLKKEPWNKKNKIKEINE